jgi:hypothetical protein
MDLTTEYHCPSCFGVNIALSEGLANNDFLYKDKSIRVKCNDCSFALILPVPENIGIEDVRESVLSLFSGMTTESVQTILETAELRDSIFV